MRGLPVAVIPLLLLSGLSQAAHVPCPPEDCAVVIPIPDVPYVTGPVQVTSFHADVRVVHGIATTSLAIRLHASQVAEAKLSLPLPAGASLLGFNLTVGQTVLEGRVTERAQAREEYNEAREAGRDAALLEEASDRLVRLSVNVPAGEERVLRAAYAEVVARAAGSRVYRLPLSQVEAASVSLDFVLQGAGASSVRFPHLDVQAVAAGQWSRDGGATEDDFVAVWSEGTGPVASLVSSRPAGQPAHWVAQLCLQGSVPLARDVVFVLDRSGSMAGAKMLQARTSMAAALTGLGPGDRYDVVAFDDHVEPFHAALVGTGNVASDQAALLATDARGGTDIDGGLQEALRLLAASPSHRLPMVVFVTDGLPSAGVTNHDRIIERFQAANTRSAVIQVVPIGLDADHTFLADLALRSGGTYTPIDPGEGDVALRLGRHFDVIGRPLLRDVEVEVHGLGAQEMYPDPLPPVYEDGCLVLTLRGQVDPEGQVVVTVRGTAAGTASGGTVPFSEDFQFHAPSIPVVPAAEQLWGRAHVANLLSRERVEGEDLRATIVEEAVRLRQLSPYTSWVITAQAVPEEPPMREHSCPTCGAAASPMYDTANSGSAQRSSAQGFAATTSGPAATGTNTLPATSGPGPTTTNAATPGPALGLLVFALLALAIRRRAP